MKLSDLSPEWVNVSEKEPDEKVQRYIDFRCPKCPDEPMPDYENMRCRIMIPVGEHGTKIWSWNGEVDFEKVTLSPSIWHHCESDPHFFIQNGEIIFA